MNQWNNYPNQSYPAPLPPYGYSQPPPPPPPANGYPQANPYAPNNYGSQWGNPAMAPAPASYYPPYSNMQQPMQQQPMQQPVQQPVQATVGNNQREPFYVIYPTDKIMSK